MIYISPRSLHYFFLFIVVRSWQYLFIYLKVLKGTNMYLADTIVLFESMYSFSSWTLFFLLHEEIHFLQLNSFSLSIFGLWVVWMQMRVPVLLQLRRNLDSNSRRLPNRVANCNLHKFTWIVSSYLKKIKYSWSGYGFFFCLLFPVSLMLIVSQENVTPAQLRDVIFWHPWWGKC